MIPLDEVVRSSLSIRPKDIVTDESGALTCCFSKYEVKQAAGRLVRFFQERTMWTSFTLSELANFYRKNGWNPDTMLFGLTGRWYNDSGECAWCTSRDYLAFTPEGRCMVTKEFVRVCSGRRPDDS